MKRLIAAIMLLFCADFSMAAGVPPAAAKGPDLVPLPVSVVPGEGVFAMYTYPRIYFTHNELAPLAGYLSEHLEGGRFVLSIDVNMPLPAEGYRLSVSRDVTKITGRDYGGVWNGIQTFLQLLPAPPVVEIEDFPALPYRGVMLDVARTFVPKEEVMRLVDNISRHKINKFHWHLTDDEGWRVEIEKYPFLTVVGGFRGGDAKIFAVYGAWDRKTGGFYTRDDIREVVEYAALRNVEVIPEIELPGHSRAAAIAYPDILCDYAPDLAPSAGYDTRNVWCAARQANYDMLDGIIGELAAMFSSPYIHLGGDEVETAQWRHCPDCQALMRTRGLTDPARLEDIFMARVVDIAARHGKTACVWNEAVASGRLGAGINGGAPDSAPADPQRSVAVWGWESIAAARRAAANGYPTVVCAGSYFYFDMRQSPGEVGHIWAGIVPPEKVYSFDFARLGFTPAEMRNVMGLEATFFTELLLENGLSLIDYQLFPRVCALAEIAWTPREKHSWADFERRLTDSHYDRLAAMGIKFRTPPIQNFERAEPGDTLHETIELGHLSPGVTLTSSMKFSTYRTAARTRCAVVEGDWFEWRFARPVQAQSIDILTGFGHLRRAGIPAGRIEISYDGRRFETVTNLHDLKATITPKKPIHAIRITSESHGNGESFTIVQPLKITTLRTQSQPQSPTPNHD